VNLARKYRPQGFSEVMGQPMVVKALTEALKRDQIAPAYLFSGPRGTGKTTCARIFARAVACLAKATEERPCGKCESCKSYLQSHAMDLIEIDGASHTGVDDVRSIIEAVAYRPNIAKRTVYIIDEVHMLSNAAFNALLKTLEEPPPHIVFLFATTELEKIPSTILSRVQRLELKRLKASELISSLSQICKAEKIKAPSEVLEKIALASDGCLRDAQTLLDQLWLMCGDQLSMELADTFLGTIGIQQEIELLTDLANKKTKDVLEKSAEYFDKGKDLVRLMERFVSWSRALLIYKSTKSAELLAGEFAEEDLKKLDKAFGPWSIEDIDRMHEIFWTSMDRIRKTELPRVAFETSLIRASRIILTEDLQTLVRKLESAPVVSAPSANYEAAKNFDPTRSFEASRNFENSRPAYQSATQAPAPKAPVNYAAQKVPASSTPPSNEPLKEVTVESLLQAIRIKRPSLQALLNCAENSSLVGNAWELKFSSGHFAYKQLSEKILKTELEQLSSQLTAGKISQVRVLETAASAKVGSTSSAQAPKGNRNFMMNAKKAILDDPMVKAASSLLDAEVESVTIEGVKQP